VEKRRKIMIEFIESPIFNNWFRKNFPEKSLLICTPYIKKQALEDLIETYQLESDSQKIDFKILLRGNTEEFTVNKSSDISVLDRLIEIPNLDLDNVRRIENLHMKAYLIDDRKLLVTSGNLTNSGMYVISRRENFEGGISTDDSETIESFKDYFERIWNQAEKLGDFYDLLVNEYSNYIKDNYSDKKVIKRIRSRKKYLFAADNDKNDINNEEIKIELTDLPPVSKVEYILPCLEILDEQDGLSYLELGDALRRKLNLKEDEDRGKAIVNDRKFGEEKGGFLVYLGLASVKKVGNHFEYRISKLGKIFLNENEDIRAKIIIDQAYSHQIIQKLIVMTQDPDFKIKDYLDALTISSDTTMKRKKGTLNKLLNFIKNHTDDVDWKNNL
jgi:hypothetical protein